MASARTSARSTHDRDPELGRMLSTEALVLVGRIAQAVVEMRRAGDRQFASSRQYAEQMEKPDRVRAS